MTDATQDVELALVQLGAGRGSVPVVGAGTVGVVSVVALGLAQCLKRDSEFPLEPVGCSGLSGVAEATDGLLHELADAGHPDELKFPPRA